jgi:predicted nucleic acid-binding protein
LKADTVVVDSCLAIKWVAEQDYAARARALLRQWGSDGFQLIVPRLFLAEVANALYQYVRIRTTGIVSITMADAHALTDALAKLVTVVNEDAGLLQRAQTLAREGNRGAIYDDIYAALAEREGCELWTADEREGCELWTADERYWNAVKQQRRWVRCVADPQLQITPVD